MLAPSDLGLIHMDEKEQEFNDFAGTGEVRQDLRRKSVRAFGYVLTSSAGLFVIRIASTAILARLLSPADFGLLMMVTAVTVIADNFRDLGLSTATIQREKINQHEVSNLFWINALAGLTLSVLLCCASPAIARFYGEPRLIAIALVLSLVFFFGGLTVQHQALLTRQMKHGKKSAIHLGAFILSSIIAIGLGLAGFGYWALVWREVAQSILVMAGIWFICPWKPGVYHFETKVGELLRFGRDMTLSQLIGAIASSLDRLLIGRFFGADLVAMYRQPYQLVVAPINQFMGPLYQISLPGLSMVQSDPTKFVKFYTRIVTLVGLASMPLSVFLALYAKEVTLVVLGAQWEQASIFFRIFAVGAFLRAVASIPGFVLVSRGRSGSLVGLTVVNSLVMAALMGLSLPWGARGVAIADVATVAVMLFPCMIYSFRDSPVTVASFLLALARPAAASLIMGCGLLLLRRALPPLGTWSFLTVGILFAPVAFLGALLVLPGGKLELTTLVSDLRAALQRKAVRRAEAVEPLAVAS